ncbi:hypothetical protein BT96DRAFT_1001837 [Gymnopus androsaceus JB14]|uniref:SAP domain-containing protein n=1 Tax=Gymnopus androsaceus JB14 TaxID=1447944 RepID=A0A6A4H119_9AGAR|nr:hypothetical protein BT96DRAFT_1001837 [Gymnopus androsaceus JB14]
MSRRFQPSPSFSARYPSLFPEYTYCPIFFANFLPDTRPLNFSITEFIAGVANAYSFLVVTTSQFTATLSPFICTIALGLILVVSAGALLHNFIPHKFFDRWNFDTLLFMATLPDVNTKVDKDNDFPFPNGVSIKLRKANLTELKEHCRTYKLTISGKKQALLERLIDYSSNPDQWTSHTAGLRQSHKGPRVLGAHGSPKKLSKVNARRQEQLGDVNIAQSSRTVLRSKDNRTQQQKDDVLAWAARMVAKYPDIQTPRKPQGNTVAATAFSVIPSQSELSSRRTELDSRLACIEGQLKTLVGAATASLSASQSGPNMVNNLPPAMESSFNDGAPFQLSTLSPMTFPSSVPFPIHASTSPSSPESTSDSSHVDAGEPVTVAAADSTAHPSTTKILILGNGTRLSFTSNDVPDPLIVSFAKNILQLGRVWDNARPEFSSSECTLKIKGHAIALKHWPTCYSYSHSNQWEGIKKSWNEWKHVAECLHKSSEEDFWKEFWNHEKQEPMSFTAITKVLRAQRKASNARVVGEEKERLGDQFSVHFHIRGKPMVCPSAIAKRSHHGQCSCN